MGLMNWAKDRAFRLRRDAHVLWIAARDQRTPFIVKAICGVIAAYVLSPIDLIPDFIPVFGLLDEMLIVPLGLAIAFALLPAPLIAEFRQQAADAIERPVSRTGALLIIGLWSLIAIFVVLQIWALQYW